MVKYPKVLILYHSCINLEDQHGVSIREWFSDWPKDRLAQVFSGGYAGGGTFCDEVFCIGERERRFGNLFIKFKLSMGHGLRHKAYVNIVSSKKSSIFEKLRTSVPRYLNQLGIAELFFRPKLSKELECYIQKFNPDIIYCQGYNLYFTELPVMIHNQFKIPIVFQTGDDWPSYLYNSSPLAFFVRPFVKHFTHKLLWSAVVRIANGKRMRMEYLDRYNMRFEQIMMCDSEERFLSAPIIYNSSSSKYNIVYTGNLGQERWKSLIEVSRALELLNSSTNRCYQLTVLATTSPEQALNALRECSNIRLLSAPSHEDLPSMLKGADILLIVESFNRELAEEIKFSISTKAHLYMLSTVPILVFGSSISGIVDYAKDEGWAITVDNPSIKDLAATIDKIVMKQVDIASLLVKARETFRLNHDSVVVKEKFRELLCSAMRS